MNETRTHYRRGPAEVSKASHRTVAAASTFASQVSRDARVSHVQVVKAGRVVLTYRNGRRV